MPLLGEKPSYGGPGTLGRGSRWQIQNPARIPLGIILHTSEQTPSTNDAINADNLCLALSKPGTAGPVNGKYGAGYHAVTDSQPFGWWQIAPDTARTNSAPPCNGTHLHICIPNRIISNGTLIPRSAWLSDPLRQHMKVAADYIVTKSRQYSIPIARINAAELRINKPGYADHQTVSLAFGKTDHIDVGTSFPWDVLASDIALLVASPPIPTPPIPIPIPIPSTVEDHMVPEIWNSGEFIRFVISPYEFYEFKDDVAYAQYKAIKPPFQERLDVPNTIFTNMKKVGTLSKEG